MFPRPDEQRLHYGDLRYATTVRCHLLNAYTIIAISTLYCRCYFVAHNHQLREHASIVPPMLLAGVKSMLA